MLLIHGTRIARHSIGFVAEECPQCQCLTVCRILEVSQGHHFFYIPLGRGSYALFHEARCLTCRHPFDVPAIYYHSFHRKKKTPVAELIPLTSPWLGTVTEDEILAETRTRLILNVFMRHDASYRERMVRGGSISAGQLDRAGTIAVLLMILIPVVLSALVMSDSLSFLTKSQATASAWVGSLLAVFWGIYMIATEDRRFFRRHTAQRMHGELAPLGAQKSDWELAIRRMKHLRFPTWRMLKWELRRRDFHLRQEAGEPDSTSGAWAPGAWGENKAAFR